MPPAPRRTTHTILSPASRRVVAGLLVATGALLLIGYGLQLYVLLYDWRSYGVLGRGPLLWVLLGLAAAGATAYVGWRVGLHQPSRPRR